ncbi:MAG: CNP1-like family protein [Janthinobacterium lividum]
MLLTIFGAAPAASARGSHLRAMVAVVALPLLLAAGANALAQSKGGAFDHIPVSEDFDDAEKTWQELSVQMPPQPVAANLLPFYTNPTATQTFAIDGSSLSIGADGVVRYVLVATSEYGARNVTYEGIRCETSEQKLYAIGHEQGSWSRSRNDSWKPIRSSASNGGQAALYNDYFCDTGLVNGKVADIVGRLRKGRQVRSSNMIGQ